MYGNIDMENFQKNHVPLATLGRFFLDNFLPDYIQRIVYIDGDTWFPRDPASLIEAVIPEGRFAAAEDRLYLRQKNNPFNSGKEIRAYLKKIGVDEKKGYFNAGVFAVSRSTWRVLADEAFAFFLQNTGDCIHHDQSALNAVMGDRRLRLSAKWNFQTPYCHFGIESAIQPCIYHFNQFPKPWMGDCEPWRNMYEEYREALKPFSTLNLPLKTVDKLTADQHNEFVRKKYRFLRLPIASSLLTWFVGHNQLERRAWM